MKYPKTETLYNRNEKFKIASNVKGKYPLRQEEYSLLKKWLVTEKIHGTNVRVILQGDGTVLFKGRTESTEHPEFLAEYLKETFTKKKMEQYIGWASSQPTGEITFFGEGYGNKIQDVGDKYISKGVGFMLFDVYANKWLNYNSVKNIAEKLEIPVAPYLGMKTIEEITEMVKNGFNSKLSESKLPAEGIVAKAEPGLLDSNGKRLMFKLKYKDFER